VALLAPNTTEVSRAALEVEVNMGWWRIDPETGEPAAEGSSKLSRPPEFVLLNAVPGVDASDDAHYLGDGPGDMAWGTARQLAELLGPEARLSAEDIRRLLLDRVVPPSLDQAPAEVRSRAIQIVDEFWPDIDDCYEFDWDRPARPAERRWVCEYVLEALAHRGVLRASETSGGEGGT
jgi:hypothetical protein